MVDSQNKILGLRFLDAQVVSLLSTDFWLPKILSKHHMLKDLWQYGFYVNIIKHKPLSCLPCPTSTILAYNILMGAHNHKRCPRQCIGMWIFSSHINSFMNCIIDQCYVCQSPINFTTYTFPYLMSLLNIRLSYDLYHYFILFWLKHKSKESKTRTILYYISHTRLHR